MLAWASMNGCPLSDNLPQAYLECSYNAGYPTHLGQRLRDAPHRGGGEPRERAWQEKEFPLMKGAE
jgi:hypothetical protein